MTIKAFKNRSFLTDLFITYSSQFIVLLVHILIIKLLADYLTEEGFGAYMVMKRVIGIAFPVLTINLSISLSRFISINENKKNKYLFLSFFTLTCITILVSIVMIIFARKTAMIIFSNSELYFLIFPLLVFVYANSIQVITVGYFRGKLEFRNMNVIIILFWVIQLFVLIAMNKYNFKPFIFLRYYYFINSILVIAICGIYIFRNNRVCIGRIINTITNIYAEIKNNLDFYKYGLYRLPNGFFLAGVFFLPVFYSSNRMSLKIAGYTGAIVTVIKMFQLVGNPIGRLFLPKISHLTIKSSKKVIKNYCQTVLEFIFTIPLLLGVLIYYIAPELITLWFGPNFNIIINYVKLISPTIGLLIGFILISSILNGLYNYPYVNFITTISFIFELLIIIISEILSLELYGIIISFGVAIVTLWLTSTVILLKKQRISVITKNNIISIFWVGLILVILSLLNEVVTFKQIIISTLFKTLVILLVLISSLLVYKKYNYKWINELLYRFKYLW